MEWMLALLVAMTVTMALIPPLIQIAGRLQVLDAPGERKVHAQPIPRVGGIAMAVGLLLALGLFGRFVTPMPAYFAGVLVLLVFGVLDDRYTLKAGPKFLGQAIAAVIVMQWGDVNIGTLTYLDRFEIPVWVSAPLTFFFLLGVTNAVNLADGLDGLAGGTTLLSLAALALLSLHTGHPFVGAVAITSIGAILGFLRFNTHPARVFMGDGGSQLLGFSAGVLAIVVTQNRPSALSTALPLLLLGVPMIDTMMVMIQRILQGRSPFSADRNHIHHRLLTLGFDHHEAVALIYCLQGTFFVAAWALRFETDLMIFAVFTTAALLLVGSLQYAQAKCWRLRKPQPQSTAPTSMLAACLKWLARPEHLPRWALHAIAVLTTVYFIVVGAFAPAPSDDVRWMAVLLVCVLLGSTVLDWRSPQPSSIQRVALYTSAVAAVYLDWHAGGVLDHVANLGDWVVFFTLVIAIVIRFRLAGDRRFRVTTLDVLVIFAAIAVPNLPGAVSTPHVGVSIAKLIALLYGLESLLHSSGRAWRLPCAAAMVFSVLCVVTR